jgi:hypothetical protein
MNFFVRPPIAQEAIRVFLNSDGSTVQVSQLQIVEIFCKASHKFFYKNQLWLILDFFIATIFVL